MIVCLCCAICKQEIIELIKEGKTTEDIILETGAGSSCGCCCECIEDMVKELREEEALKKVI